MNLLDYTKNSLDKKKKKYVFEVGVYLREPGSFF